MKHKASFPVYLDVQPPVEQITICYSQMTSFHSECFEQKTVLFVLRVQSGSSVFTTDTRYRS